MKTLIGLLILATASNLGWSGELESQSHAARQALRAVSLNTVRQQAAPTVAKGVPLAAPTELDGGPRLTKRQAQQAYEQGSVPNPYYLNGTWNRLPLQGEQALRDQLNFELVGKSLLTQVWRKYPSNARPSVTVDVDEDEKEVRFSWPDNSFSCRAIGDQFVMVCKVVNAKGLTFYFTYEKAADKATAVTVPILPEQP